MKKMLLNWVMRNVFKAITLKELELEFKHLPEGEREMIMAEARQFVDTRLWEFLVRDTRRTALKQMGEKAGSTADIRFARSHLWVIDLLDRKMKKLSAHK